MLAPKYITSIFAAQGLTQATYIYQKGTACRMDKRETGTRTANTHTLIFTSHNPDSYQNYYLNANGKNVSAIFCASEECRDLMTPGAHAETITKRYGMS